jgi:membrane dipeptidase
MPLASVGAMLAGEVGPAGSTEAARTAETAAAALEVLRGSVSVDVHSHGGKTGITSKAPRNGDLAKAMRAGSLSVACLADVPDWPVLGRSAAGVLAAIRAPEPGELYHYHLSNRLAICSPNWMIGAMTSTTRSTLPAPKCGGSPALLSERRRAPRRAASGGRQWSVV